MGKKWLVEILCSSDECIHRNPEPFDERIWCMKMTKASAGGRYIECDFDKCPVRVRGNDGKLED